MRTKETIKTKIIGHVSVDSGQILITDPCYIDSEWKRDTEPNWEDRIRDIKTGKIYELYKDFNNFEDKLINGKNINELIGNGEFEQIEPKHSFNEEFSLRGCTDTVFNKKEQGGQLKHELRHAGAGVVAESGLGDGHYPVVAHYIDCGTEKHPDIRIKKLEILFIE